MNPTFFPTPNTFRKWLKKNHDKKNELLVGFYKRDSGKPSITWPESVDAALSFGWIDGVRRRIDDESYTIRFTPRRRGSIWSAINIKRVGELEKLGLMTDAGRRAFEARDEKKSAIYSYEKASQTFPPEMEKRFRANKKAWTWWSEQPPWYRRVTTHWVVSAKKDETRERRLATLIEDSAQGRRIRGVIPSKPRKS
jgi:uncharacterized protein YdeI (YjbR/CyaY-like superfamily)